MNRNRKKRQIKILLEDKWVFLWLPPLLLLYASFWIWNTVATGRSLSLGLVAEKAGIVQLFVDDGSGFSEAHSLRYELSESAVNTFQQVTFDLDSARFGEVVQFRLDPMNNDGSVVLHELKYKRSGEWLKRSLLAPEYPGANDLRWQWNAKAAELGVYPSPGNRDPHFLITGDFESIAASKLYLKRVWFHLSAILVGTLLGFLFREQLLSVLSFLWETIIMVPWARFKKMQLAYTVWVNRLSLKWGMVNPTSCVVGAALIAGYSWFLMGDSKLFTEREARLVPVLQFEIKGNSSEKCYVYARIEGQEEKPLFASDNTATIHSGETVSIPLFHLSGPMEGLRIDPMEKKGSIELSNLRLSYAGGKVVPLSLADWIGRGHAQILASSEQRLLIQSSGIDPFISSRNLAFEIEGTSTIPCGVALPFTVFFFGLIALLLYNRLWTEELSVEQIRSLQQN